MALNALFTHQAAKGALETVFIDMMRGFDCCKLVINCVVGCGKKAFDRFLTMIFFRHGLCPRYWLTRLCGSHVNRWVQRCIVTSHNMSLVIFGDFWHQQFLPNIFIGAVIDPLVKRLFIRPLKCQTTTNQLLAPD